MSIPTSSKTNGGETYSTYGGISSVIGEETVEQRRDREFKTREMIRSNNDTSSLNFFGFLILLFSGLKEDSKLSSNEAVSEMASALSVDNSFFSSTVDEYKSGNISAFEAAKLTVGNINHTHTSSPANNSESISTYNTEKAIAQAEAVVVKYAQSGNPLLELIAAKESGGDYNRVYGKGVQRENLTEMTIDQVLEWQRNYVNNGSPSSAAGKYQIIRKTLAGLKDEMGLSGNELFDEKMQDRMAMHLLNRRGYDDYLDGKIDDSTFMENVAKEWASMPKDESGLSYYAGDGLNKAHASPTTLLLAMRSAKDITNQQSATLSNTFAQGGVETNDPKQPEPLVTAFDGKGRDQVAMANNVDQINNDTNIAPSITTSPT